MNDVVLQLGSGMLEMLQVVILAYIGVLARRAEQSSRGAERGVDRLRREP